jgi:ADP-heptose:LPS heptosyltransferase
VSTGVAACFDRRAPFFDPGTEHAIEDFWDTTALVECCDLVITVNTSIAHLNGALGKRVWILLPHNPDWRWFEEGSRSPWYPSAVLYRQPPGAGWESVIERVAEALERRLAEDATAQA